MVIKKQYENSKNLEASESEYLLMNWIYQGKGVEWLDEKIAETMVNGMDTLMTELGLEKCMHTDLLLTM